ncbi:MAG: prepilin-type N-terminal cleavage/methylation domain-containing protein [Planctomycetota bacterium]|jgi:prepilin-type N-terminal cleavage/methylation domain-containing protein
MNSRRPPRTGFTLLEILIAIAILAIGLVTVFSLFPLGIWAVKQTVESTRGSSLARTARADLAAMRADQAIQNAGSPYYAGGYVPFGTWEKPSHLWLWREYLYQYVDTAATPALHSRVLFDDRTMIPVTLTGVFNAGNRVTVVRPGLTRDSDLLEHYYDSTNPGPDMYNPWEIRLKVRGLDYLIFDRGYAGPSATDLDWLDVDPGGPALPDDGAGGAVTLPFEILLPVALKEPPMDSPLENTGAAADFTGGAGPHPIWSSYETRSVALHLRGDVNGGSWISVPQLNTFNVPYKDWFHVTAVTTNANGMPDTMTLKAGVYPAAANEVRFELVLPVVTFDSLGAIGDLQSFIMWAGGGPDLALLESGAWVEFVLDGGLADFRPDKPSPPFPPGISRTTVLNFTNTNADTTPFILPGNFIRIYGRDYEIAAPGLYDADTDGSPDDFDLVGTAPTFGVERYFNIVLGYNAAAAPPQLPGVARFPVTRVTRTPTVGGPPTAYPVTSFLVGRDSNGNLPADIWPAAAPDPYRTPVRILPANRSSYCYQVTMSQKSSVGVFANGSTTVNGPNWPVSSPTTPIVPAIPFPSIINPNDPGLGGNSSVYQMRLLTTADAAGTYQQYDIPANALDWTSLTLGGAGATFSGWRPFHAFDRNDFHVDLTVGGGTYASATMTVNLTSSSADAIFLAPGTYVQLTGPFGVGQWAVTSVSPQLTSFTIFDILGMGYYPNNGDVVTVQIASDATVAPRPSVPFGRGNFVTGSDTVLAVYLDTADNVTGLFPGIPGRGLPYSVAAAQRYHLAVGDYIMAPDGQYYAVRAIHDDPGLDFIVLDRPYTGASNANYYFRYVTPIQEVYTAQVAVHRNYRMRALYDQTGTRDLAAAFGFDVAGVLDPTRMKVRLAVTAPPDVKPGDYIRADGDADHPVGGPPFIDPGLHGGQIDGDRQWYMIDSIGPNVPESDPNYRREITLTSPYRGYVPTAEVFQPASVSPSVIRTFDTVIGAF